ncbi:MAG: CoA transferase [Chloroflexota bacterium]|nr:CoA transferase [Chloroflexota bacterium]
MSSENHAPLEGVKVLEFQWVFAGPASTAYLSSYGATVIKVESEHAPDVLRVSPPYKDGKPGVNRAYGFCISNSTKYDIALDMGREEARAVARRLVAWADVVATNYVPGNMEKWGLSYEEVKKIRPDIIMVCSSLQGQTGPRRVFGGFGPHSTALAGFNHLTGWPDREGAQPHMAYTDFIAPWFATLAILAALDHRRRTGQGQRIDLSQMEASLHFLATALLDYTANGREQIRQGNRSPCAAPHGAYPCLGNDRWCAIAVLTDHEWQALRQAMGDPEWARHPKFSTLKGRKTHEDELDEKMAEWTMCQTAEDVMNRLQQAGVAAGVVQSAQDLVDKDPQLKEWGIFRELEHPEMGPALHYGWPVRLSQAEARLERAPMLGEHTEYVCCQVLGMSDEEFTRLMQAGIFQ